MLRTDRPSSAVAICVLAMSAAIVAVVARPPSATDQTCFAGRAPCAPPRQIVEHVRYRKTSEFDPGTIRICLRNISRNPMRFDRIEMDGLPLPAWGVNMTWETYRPGDEMSVAQSNACQAGDSEDIYERATRRLSGKRVVWARMAPPEIAPGGVGEFSAKLAHPMPRPMKMEFFPTGRESIPVVIRPAKPRLEMTAITFSRDLDRIHVYINGESESPLTIMGLEKDGRWLSEGLWLSSTTLRKGEKQLAIVTPAQKLIPGEHLTLRVVCAGSISAMDRVRVITGFPINQQYGVPPAGFHMDPSAYTMQPKFMSAKEPRKEAPAVSLPSDLRGNMLLDCPLCVHGYRGDKSRTACEILRRHDLCREFDPRHPGVMHACRIRAELGYALFAETGDILSFNPSIRSGLSQTDKPESPAGTVARICDFGYRAARPRPYMCMVDTTSIGSPAGKANAHASAAEFRTRVYALVGKGAKGFFYRHHDWEGRGASAGSVIPEIKRVNQEVAHIRELLATADVVDWAKVSSRTDIAAHTLLATDQAIILVLVSTADTPDAAVGRASVRMRVPRWAEVTGCSLLTTQGLEPVQCNATDEMSTRLCLDLASDLAAAAWVMHIRRRSQ